MLRLFLLLTVMLSVAISPALAMNTGCAFADAALRSSMGHRVRLVVPRAVLSLELARTPMERERGLMYRKTLARHHGMIFLYDHDTKLRFWMKHTLIPLDLIIIKSNGQVSKIASHLLPGGSSPDWQLPITTGEGCVVVEIPAGEARRNGITSAISRLYFAKKP